MRKRVPVNGVEGRQEEGDLKLIEHQKALYVGKMGVSNEDCPEM